MGATPIKNITLKQGEDYSCVAVVEEDGVPFDISGWTLMADVKASYDPAATPLASFTFSFVTDGTDGQYERSMDKTAIDAITATSAVWDQFYEQGGVVTKLMRGDVTIEPSATDTTP